MNQYFTGYQTVVPVWIFVILLIITTILSWWTYSKLKPRPIFLKYVLISLRSIVFFIILLVLINPVFESVIKKNIKSNIAVMLDNSQSMSISKGDYHGQASYRNVLKELDLRDTSNIRYDIYSFGGKIRRESPDSISLNEGETDISGAVSQLSMSGKSFKALILVTDGIYTVGRDPSYLASNLGFPVYTIAMGDTIHKNDIIVQNLSVNRDGYLNTIIPVEASIINDGLPNRKIQVQLWHNQRIIQKKDIETRKQKSVQSVTFKFRPEDTGLQQYRIVVPEIKGEWTKANNQKVFNIDIRNDKIKILDLAFSIHPDVKTIRSILESDKSIEMKELTWIGKHRFLRGPLPSRIDTMNMVILHGFPNDKLSDSEAAEIYNLIKEKPVLLISTPGVNYHTLNELFPGELPIITKNQRLLSAVQWRPNPENLGNPILNLPSFNLANLPDVYAPIDNATASPGSKVLFYADYRGANTKVPVVAIKSIGNRKISQINIAGFFKWYQNEVPGSRNYITAFVNNIVKWTSVKPDNRLLKIDPARKVFNGSEDVILNASLINESGLAEDKGKIDVTLSGTKYPAKSFMMENQGDGRYSLNPGVLPGGIYQFKATAKVDFQVLDSEKGQFSVGNTNTEFINTTRNDALLHYIAKRSGGAYFTFKDAARVVPAMQSKGLLKPLVQKVHSRFYVHRSLWWFAVILVLLSTEWFIRKYLALP